jgi:hypothetical protein
MNWEAIGAVGELVGALAVFATLIYLAVQVRHSRNLLEDNRKLILSQVYQGRASFRQRVHSELVSPEISKIAAKVTMGNPISTGESLRRFNELELHEQIQYRNVQEQWCVMMDDALVQIELGLVDEKAVESAHGFIRGTFHWWDAIGCTISPRLREWTEQQDLRELGA